MQEAEGETDGGVGAVRERASEVDQNREREWPEPPRMLAVF